MLKYLVPAFLLLSSAAIADPAGPQVSAQSYISALSAQRNSAQDAAALAQGEVTDLQAKLDALQKDYDAMKAKQSPSPTAAPAQ